MADWTWPDWMTMPDWFDPKLLVLFILIGFVLYVSREPAREPEKAKLVKPERDQQSASHVLKHGQR